MIIRKINTLICIGLTAATMIGSSFAVDIYRVFRGDEGIWWTHRELKLPLEETKDVFELYIGGKLLRKHLADRTLYSVDKDGNHYPVVSRDVTVRLNNWEKTKASILTRAVVTGVGFGAAIALLITGVIQAVRREENSR